MTNLNKVDNFMIFNVLKNLNLKGPNFLHFEVIALLSLEAAGMGEKGKTRKYSNDEF